MFQILTLFTIFCSLGVYLIINDLGHMPTRKAEKTYLLVAQNGNEKVSVLTLLHIKLSSALSQYIKINHNKKRKYEMLFKSAQIKISPEMYMAKAIVKSGAILFFAIPALLIFPLMAPLCVIISILVYFKEMGSVEEEIRELKEAIEYELPRFTNTLLQELEYSRDILSILESYKNHTGDRFKRELEITIADMKSGSYEEALKNFDRRIHSSKLSGIIYGLIRTINGDDNRVYFQMRSYDLKQWQFEKLKREAMKRPHKIRKYNMLLLGCFIGIYLVVMLLEIIKGMNMIF